MLLGPINSIKQFVLSNIDHKIFQIVVVIQVTWPTFYEKLIYYCYLARSCISFLKFHDGPSYIARFCIFFKVNFFPKMSQILSKFTSSSYKLEKWAKLLGPFLYVQIH